MNIDVFISHSSKDAKIANAICNTLEANNMRCWLAPRDIRPGSDWAESINNAIENSKVMVLVFSENSNNSAQVAKELNLAINNKLVVLPFKIDDSTPTGSMKYYLSDTHWLDAINGDIKDEIKNLTDVLISVLSHTTPDTKNKDNTTSDQTSKNNASHTVNNDGLVANDIVQQNMNDKNEEQSELQRARNISWKSISIICGIILIVIIAAIWGRSSNIDNTDIQNSSTDETGIISVGDTITLGAYEQDNDLNNGSESIEWLVLDEKEDSYILLSNYILDVMPYNYLPGPVEWKECTLRSWLNNEFVNQAFSQDEKNMIISQEQNSDEMVSLFSVVHV